MIGLIFDVQPEFAEYVGSSPACSWVPKRDAAGCIDATEYVPAGSLLAGEMYEHAGIKRNLDVANWVNRDE